MFYFEFCTSNYLTSKLASQLVGNLIEHMHTHTHALEEQDVEHRSSWVREFQTTAPIRSTLPPSSAGLAFAAPKKGKELDTSESSSVVLAAKVSAGGVVLFLLDKRPRQQPVHAKSVSEAVRGSKLSKPGSESHGCGNLGLRKDDQAVMGIDPCW